MVHLGIFFATKRKIFSGIAVGALLTSTLPFAASAQFSNADVEAARQKALRAAQELIEKAKSNTQKPVLLPAQPIDNFNTPSPQAPAGHATGATPSPAEAPLAAPQAFTQPSTVSPPVAATAAEVTFSRESLDRMAAFAQQNNVASLDATPTFFDLLTGRPAIYIRYTSDDDVYRFKVPNQNFIVTALIEQQNGMVLQELHGSAMSFKRSVLDSAPSTVVVAYLIYALEGLPTLMFVPSGPATPSGASPSSGLSAPVVLPSISTLPPPVTTPAPVPAPQPEASQPESIPPGEVSATQPVPETVPTSAGVEQPIDVVATLEEAPAEGAAQVAETGAPTTGASVPAQQPSPADLSGLLAAVAQLDMKYPDFLPFGRVLIATLLDESQHGTLSTALDAWLSTKASNPDLYSKLVVAIQHSSDLRAAVSNLFDHIKLFDVTHSGVTNYYAPTPTANLVPCYGDVKYCQEGEKCVLGPHSHYYCSSGDSGSPCSSDNDCKASTGGCDVSSNTCK